MIDEENEKTKKQLTKKKKRRKRYLHQIAIDPTHTGQPKPLECMGRGNHRASIPPADEVDLVQ